VSGRPTADATAILARSYEDPRRGIRERFLQPTLGGGRTVAVLSEPLGEARGLGWVLCHSFGSEQIHLQPLEVAAARALASAGFPALRFHAPGYGDSEVSQMDVGADAHLDALLGAVQVLRDEAAVTAGIIGARFGGTLAAIAAERLGARALVVWDPVVDGARYMSRLLRGEAAADLAVTQEDALPPAEAPSQILAAHGLVQAQGFPLRRVMFDAISGIDLRREIRSFDGDALVLQVSRTPAVRADIWHLADRLGGAGGRCTVDGVVDRSAPLFGDGRYRLTERGTKRDAQAAMSREIVERTVRWALGLAGGDAAARGAS
jgi:pimeloyl-ACP methyl ester carboxylesterase